jgi:predicted PurR-regulated permease PerM
MQRDALDRHLTLRVLLYVVTLIAVLYAGGLVWQVILHFSSIILIFFLAWVIKFILQPLATFLERHGLSRLTSVSLIYVALLALMAGSIVEALPSIHAQAQALAQEATSTLAPGNLQHLGDSAVSYLHHLGLSVQDARSLVNQFSGAIPAMASNLSTQAVATSTNLLGAAANLFLDAIIVLILSFYMMLDGDRLAESWVQKLPPSWIPDIRRLQGHIDVIFGGFLRAQVIIAFVYGVLTWLVLAVVGQANGLIFALVAAVLILLPFIGPFLAIVPPAALVVLQSPSNRLIGNLLIVIVLLFAAQQITLQVVAPRIMSAHVGLHPLLLFAALLVGTEEGGVWGAVFAGPIAAVLVAMLDTFFERFQQSSALYPDIRPCADTVEEMEQQAQPAHEAEVVPGLPETASEPPTVAAVHAGVASQRHSGSGAGQAGSRNGQHVSADTVEGNDSPAHGD